MTKKELETFSKAEEYYFGTYPLTDYYYCPDWYIELLLEMREFDCTEERLRGFPIGEQKK